MSLADELAGLQELHQKGTLTDEEFAKAKATLLETPPAQPLPHSAPVSTSSPDAGRAIGCLVTLAILGTIAYFAYNPIKQAITEIKQKTEEARDAHEQLEGTGPRRLDGAFQGAPWNHRLVLTNISDDVLTEATLTVAVIRPDKKEQPQELKAYWDRWTPGEKKEVKVFGDFLPPANFGTVVTGHAYIVKNGERKKVTLVLPMEFSRK